MEQSLTVSSSPHITGRETSSRIMWTVFGALTPAAAASVYLFGVMALNVIVGTILLCVWFEVLANLALRRPLATVTDGSAALTGLLLALTLPPGLSLWFCAVGAFVAIVMTKAVFGGLGQNPFNPAITARVFLLIAFPEPLTRWPVPLQTEETLYGQPVAIQMELDAITAATPLGLISDLGAGTVNALASVADIYIGRMNGSLGETSGILLLLGGVFLLLRRIISWHIPVSFLAGMSLVAGITHLLNPAEYVGIPFHLFTGGALLGAFFMATDYVTSPMFPRGKLLFGLGCGLLTMIIRLWGGYPEGVSFAILLMNAVVPIIDTHTRPAPFGKSVTSPKGGADA